MVLLRNFGELSWIRLSIMGCILLFNIEVSAEVVFDGTLGQSGNVPLVNQQFNIKQSDGRTSDGRTNLFHSFRTFNVNTGETAIFRVEPSIINVLARVTGGKESLIDGTLSIWDEAGSKANANLYLLNPKGFIFGKNATLDMSGSFYASTANRIKLGDRDEESFYADPSKKSTFSFAPPSAFGFLDSEDVGASIEIQGNAIKNSVLNNSTFYTPKGQIRALVNNDDLTFKDSTLYAPNGKIDIRARNIDVSGGKIDVSGGKEKGQISIHAEDKFVAKGRWTLLDDSGSVAVAKEGIGIFADDNDSVDISALKISLTNGFQIMANNSNSEEHQDDVAIALTSKDRLFIGVTDQEINGIRGEQMGKEVKGVLSEGIFSLVRTINSGHGTSAKIQITTPTLEIKHGLVDAIVNNCNDCQERGINSAKGGNIVINADKVQLEDGYINTSLYPNSTGQGGNINITSNLISLSMDSGIAASAVDGTIGNAGDVVLETHDLDLTNGAAISAHSFESSSKGGLIKITAHSISLSDNSRIFTAATKAEGGDIVLQVSDKLYVANSEITAKSLGDERGNNGGNITIKDPKLLIWDKALLLATAREGRGGNINIVAKFILGWFEKNLSDHPADPSQVAKKEETEQEKLENGEFVRSGSNKPFSVIDATSEKNISGNVEINARRWEFPDLKRFDSNFSRDELSLSRCALFFSKKGKFFITARDILPRCPEDLRTQTIRLGR